MIWILKVDLNIGVVIDMDMKWFFKLFILVNYFVIGWYWVGLFFLFVYEGIIVLVKFVERVWWWLGLVGKVCIIFWFDRSFG